MSGWMDGWIWVGELVGECVGGRWVGGCVIE